MIRKHEFHSASRLLKVGTCKVAQPEYEVIPEALVGVICPSPPPGLGWSTVGTSHLVSVGGSLGRWPTPRPTEALNPGSPWAESAEKGSQDRRRGGGGRRK